MTIEIICGDSLKLLPTFNDKEFDYFLTSPPFKEEEFGGDDYWKNMDFVVSELKRITSKGGFMLNSAKHLKTMIVRYPDILRILIWVKWGCLPLFYRFEPIFVWQNDSFKMNNYIWSDCLTVRPIAHNGGTYENPIKLYKYLLRGLPKGRIIDPFLGTGTTAKACRMLGHSCVGIEIDPKKPCFEKGIMPFLEVSK